MGAKCPICKHSGGNMKQCEKCGMIYCVHCATKGLLNGNKVAANKCPYCGSNKIKPAK